MSPRTLIPFLVLALAACVGAQPSESTTVFKAKETSAHPSIRIPALLHTAKGTLIAVAEGRDAPTDQASNDLIVRLSTNGGKTWTKSDIALELGKDCINNPCLVQDAKSGKVFLFYQVFPAGMKEFGGLTPGPSGPTKIAYITSDNEGRSWSKPVDVTTALKPEIATTTASGPGIGIQLTKGPKAGRLIIPFNSQGPKGTFVNWVAYSDDAGRTWKRGSDVPQVGMQLNEVQVSETADGGIYLNSRQWRGSGGRKASWSSDGGETWSPAIEDKSLPEPVCQGSLISFEDKGRHVTLFLNPEGEPAGKGRKRGVLRMSLDGGKTWAKSRVIVPGAFAYSSIARLKDGRIAVLYEPAGHSEIKFLTVDLAWLEGGS
jgi:sialidase-1